MANRQGFTIIEVLVAVFLLSIALAVPLTEVFVRTNLQVRHMQIALAQEKDLLEHIRSLNYNSPYLVDDGDTTDLDDKTTPDYFVGSANIKGIKVTRFYNVANDVPSPGLKTIKVFIVWEDRRTKKTHELSAITIKNPRW